MPNAEQIVYQTDKSSHRKCSTKETVLKNFAIFTGKLLRSLFNKVADLQAASGLTLESDYLKICF